jgi:hypothetical protein
MGRTCRHLGVSLLLLGACGGPTSPDPDWLEVKEQTSCEALVPAFCVGTYGFTVHDDGRFTVGPAPNGVSLTGATSGEVIGPRGCTTISTR